MLPTYENFCVLGVVGSRISCLSCGKGITLRRKTTKRSMKGRLNYIALCLLSLLFACREGKKDGQLLGSIEQTWQLCEVSLPEAEARAETQEDSVRKASELVRQRYSLLTIRLRDKRGMTRKKFQTKSKTLITRQVWGLIQRVSTI